MFLDNIRLRIENNNTNLRKTVCNCGLRLVRKWLTLSLKWLWKKSSKNKKQKKTEKILRNESKNQYYGLIKSFFAQSETTFLKQFFLNFNFLFSVLGSLFSRNRCKLRRKLRNAPLRSKFQILWKFNSDKSYHLFVFHFKLSKACSPCVFFKDKLRLYVFESLKWKTKKI